MTPRAKLAGSRGGVYSIPIDKVYSAIMLLIMAASTFLVRFSISGIPVRTGLLLFGLSVTFVCHPKLLSRACAQNSVLICLIAYFASCGLLSSLLNGESIMTTLQQTIEIHLQAVMSLVLFSVFFARLGVARFIRNFSAPIVVSVIVALFQFAGLGFAWSMYDYVASLQPQSTAELEYHDPHYRALGLSYSPVHLGTQICLVFALWYMSTVSRLGGYGVFRPRGQRFLLIAVLLFFIASMASGNRSPLLGMVIFLAFYTMFSRPILGVFLLVAFPVAMMLQPIFIEIMNASGVRVFNTENSSGEGRAALRMFGMLLVLDQPFGYGLGFESTQYWWRHWEHLRNYENAEAITLHALHNFYLVTLNKHGIWILLPLVWLAPRLRSRAIPLLGLLPYAVHCFYHNAGPTNGDFMFWYIVPPFVMYGARASIRRANSRNMGTHAKEENNNNWGSVSTSHST